MLVAELRYAGWSIAFIAVFALAGLGAFATIDAGRVSPANAFFVLIGSIAVGIAALFAAWKRFGGSSRPDVRARYAPIVFPIALIAVQIYFVWNGVAERGWAPERNAIALALSSTCWLAYTSISDVRSRFGLATKPPVAADRQLRFGRISSLPEGSERSIAMRYLNVSWLIVGAGLVATLATMRWLGFVGAFLVWVWPTLLAVRAVERRYASLPSTGR